MMGIKIGSQTGTCQHQRYVGTFRWWWLLHSWSWLLFRCFLSFGNLKDTDCVSITREMLCTCKWSEGSAAQDKTEKINYSWSFNKRRNEYRNKKDRQQNRTKQSKILVVDARQIRWHIFAGQRAELQQEDVQVYDTFWWDFLSHFNFLGLDGLLNGNSGS